MNLEPLVLLTASIPANSLSTLCQQPVNLGHFYSIVIDPKVRYIGFSDMVDSLIKQDKTLALTLVVCKLLSYSKGLVSRIAIFVNFVVFDYSPYLVSTCKTLQPSS